MVGPRPRLAGVAGHYDGRPVLVENGHLLAQDPAALVDQPIFDDLGQAWGPCGLLYRRVSIQPGAGAGRLRVAVAVDDAIAPFVEQRDGRDARIDAGGRPDLG